MPGAVPTPVRAAPPGLSALFLTPHRLGLRSRPGPRAPAGPGVGEQFRAQAGPRAEARSPAQRLGLGRDRETQLSSSRVGRRGRCGAGRPDAQAERTPTCSQAAPGPVLRGARLYRFASTLEKKLSYFCKLCKSYSAPNTSLGSLPRPVRA